MRGDCVLVQQSVTRGGDHHRVEHVGAPVVVPDRAGNEVHQRRGGQHSGLDRHRGKVFGQRRELGRDDFFGHRVHGAHADGVLGGDRHDHRGSVDPELMEGLEVRLDAGATAGIGAGNGERDWRWRSIRSGRETRRSWSIITGSLADA